MKFSIISPGWNCGKYVTDWYQSLKNQRGSWKAYVMDDGSRDNTYAQLKALGDSRISITKGTVNRGAAYARYQLLQQCDPNSIIICLDLDDYITDRTLTRVGEAYRRGKLMTVGSHTLTTGGTQKNKFYSSQQVNQNIFPRGPFHVPPLRTFHGSLIKCLKEEDMKVNGKWVNTCTDVALMWPLIWELSHRQIQVMRHITYVYRKRSGGQSSKRFDKTKMMRELRKKYPKTREKVLNRS